METERPEITWQEREQREKEKWKANPLWYRGTVFTLRWTVGLVFALLAIGLLLGMLSGWNPVGGN